MLTKGSHWVAATNWISFFVLAWLLIVGRIEADAKTLFFISFFFLIALVASAVSLPTPKGG